MTKTEIFVEVDAYVIEQVTDDLKDALCDLLSDGASAEDAKRVTDEIASIESILKLLMHNVQIEGQPAFGLSRSNAGLGSAER